jgi:hypothetical protein
VPFDVTFKSGRPSLSKMPPIPSKLAIDDADAS